MLCRVVFFFQAKDGIRDLVRSRGLGDVYKRQQQMYAGNDAQISKFRTSIEPRLRPDTSIRGREDAGEQINAAIDRAQRFLTLASLVTVILAAVAAAMAARRYAMRHLDNIALLKTLGASQRFVVAVTMGELGLIIVDEEHDSSFKQQDGIRYSARDLAVFRAHDSGIRIVLGSATPSLESWANAQGVDGTGRYRLLSLRERAFAGACLPLLRCIDTRFDKLQDGLSGALLLAIEQRLVRAEQSLVFLNRRGYAPVLACAACGWTSHCHRCAANLVLHLADRCLRCYRICLVGA